MPAPITLSERDDAEHHPPTKLPHQEPEDLTGHVETSKNAVEVPRVRAVKTGHKTPDSPISVVLRRRSSIIAQYEYELIKDQDIEKLVFLAFCPNIDAVIVRC